MNRMQLGLIVGISDDPRASFERVLEVGIPTCQVACSAEHLVGKLNPDRIRAAAEATGIAITSIFLGFNGQVYDNHRGPSTMGLVPLAFRQERLALAKRFSDTVREIGVPSVFSHIGFIPDDENDPLYVSFIEVMKELVGHCGANGQTFCFETGQELPSTLKRTIRDIGMGNVGINFDPANLVLYGKANPIDAVEIFGEYVKGMHAKDGVWPNRDEYLGHETPLGQGMVRFDLVIPRLKKRGFRGPITIEREISGPQQKADILKAKELLAPFLDL